jgi:peptidoglycan/xylan/chitin deacetylase (PgdA/CDA1 family)
MMMFKTQNKVPVLLFHSISTRRNPLYDPVDVELFERIVRYFAQNYTLTTPEALWLGKIEQVPPNPAIITFDDGYKDFIDYALPILQRYSAPAAMYIITECVENGLPPWTHQLDYIFLNTQKSVVPSVLLDSLPRQFRQSSWTNQTERKSFVQLLKPYLKKINNDQRITLLKLIHESINDVEIPRNLMMNAEEVRQISQAGIEVGSHTHTHPLLANISNDAEVLTELTLSAELIQAITGIRPKTISYPVGSVNPRIEMLSQNAGYHIGMAVINRAATLNDVNLLSIPRINIVNESYWKARLRIQTAIWGLYS